MSHRRLVTVTSIFLLGACTSTAGEGDAGHRPARALSAPAANADGVTRVLVYYDMEGLAGQNDYRTFLWHAPYARHYATGREWLTAEVNAVVEGLLAGGADDVHVVDAHGGANPEPDILVDKLHPRAELVWRDAPFHPYYGLIEAGAYDAVAAVAMHAKTGSVGFASHSFELGIEMVANGMTLTETEMIGFLWGRVGVPVVFVAGDDRLAADLETMPWLEYVTTKKATSASTAELRPIPEVRAEERERAERAVRNLGSARAMTLTAPVQIAIRAVPPSSLAALEGVPGLAYRDGVITFEADDFLSGFKSWESLVRVASIWHDLLVEVVARQPNGAAILGEYVDAIVNRWLDYESGRWISPSPPEPRPGRRYHGRN